MFRNVLGRLEDLVSVGGVKGLVGVHVDHYVGQRLVILSEHRGPQPLGLAPRDDDLEVGPGDQRDDDLEVGPGARQGEGR